MNTPNPLIPQGSLQQHQSRGKSAVRIAVFTIIAIHAVFFTGLLMQGCRQDADKSASKSPGTPAESNAIPKLDPSYYSNVRDLPSVAATNVPGTSTVPAASDLTQIAQPPPTPSPTTPPPLAETSLQTKEYTIARGDTLSKIAKAHRVTLAALNKANPGVEPNRLKVGQKIQIPATTAATSGGGPGLGFAEPSSTEGVSNLYVVKAGDTLNKIAHQYGTSVNALRAANSLKTDRLLVGKKLKIPASKKTAASAATGASPSGPPTVGLSTNILTANPIGGPGSNPRQ